MGKLIVYVVALNGISLAAKLVPCWHVRCDQIELQYWKNVVIHH